MEASGDLASANMTRLDLLTHKWHVDVSNNQELPAQRCASAMVHRVCNNSLVVFGGYGEPTSANDMWEYQLENATWQKVKQKNTIAARYSHGMVYDKNSDSLFVYGGILETSAADFHVHKFSFSSLQWSIYDKFPSYIANIGFSGYGFAAYVLNDDLVLFLGNDCGTLLLCYHNTNR